VIPGANGSREIGLYCGVASNLVDEHVYVNQYQLLFMQVGQFF